MKDLTHAADTQKGFKEVAQLQEQLQAVRKALDEAEANQREPKEAQGDVSANLGSLIDKRRRLALQLKAARDKVGIVVIYDLY